MLPDVEAVRVLEKKSQTLVILPVFNEMPILRSTLAAIRSCCALDIVAIDDCSTDGSYDYLLASKEVSLLRHRKNAGAGGVLLRGFSHAAAQGYKNVITMDSDGQHNACQIHEFLYELESYEEDMVWGTRYPAGFTPLAGVYQHRQEVNAVITNRLTSVTGWHITDSFCGFRAYRVDALHQLEIKDTGYGMLLELTLRAWKAGFSMREHPVPLIYLDEERDFQNIFKDSSARLGYYNQLIDNTLEELG